MSTNNPAGEPQAAKVGKNQFNSSANRGLWLGERFKDQDYFSKGF